MLLTLFMNILIPIVVGCVPALLVRYVFVKRPLRKRTALLVGLAMTLGGIFLSLSYTKDVGLQRTVQGLFTTIAIWSFFILRAGARKTERKGKHDFTPDGSMSVSQAHDHHRPEGVEDQPPPAPPP